MLSLGLDEDCSENSWASICAFSGNSRYYWIFYSILIQYWLFFSSWQQQAIIKRLQRSEGCRTWKTHRILKVQHGPANFGWRADLFGASFLVTVMDRELKLSQMYVWGEVTHLVICCQRDCMFEYRFVEGHLEYLLQGTESPWLTTTSWNQSVWPQQHGYMCNCTWVRGDD